MSPPETSEHSDTTTGLTVPVGIVRLLKSVKIPAGYKEMVKAQIHGEVATNVLLLFTPTLLVPDVLLPDVVSFMELVDPV